MNQGPEQIKDQNGHGNADDGQTGAEFVTKGGYQNDLEKFHESGG
jgi:hypothetical protein